MSAETQGHKVKLQTMAKVVAYKKKLIPTNIPETYEINPKLAAITGSNEATIRSAVLTLRDFLHSLFDHLAKSEYAVPPKKPTSAGDYPFIGNISTLLVEIGYNGCLDGDSLMLEKMPVAKKNCYKFLEECGFVFAETTITFPNNPAVLVGLKAMAFADMELRTTRRFKNDDQFLRLDYHLLKADPVDMYDVLKDHIHPLHEKVQDFILHLHKRYVSAGLTCAMRILGDVTIAYADMRASKKEHTTQDIYQKRLYEISHSIAHSYCLYVRAKKTAKYAPLIETFPPYLQEKIANGYGCDRKRGEPCQGGCQGIRIPLDETVLDIADEIAIWLDNELPPTHPTR